MKMPYELLVIASLAPNVTAQGTLLDGHPVSTLMTVQFTPQLAQNYSDDSIVGPGVEIPTFGPSGFLTIDFADSTVTITSNIVQPPALSYFFGFSDLAGTIAPFETVSLGAGTTWPNIHPQLTADSITFGFPAGSTAAGSRIVLVLNEIPSPSAVVCVPNDAGVSPCPCAEPYFVPEPQGAAGHGCANSRFADGAQLAAYGFAVVGPPPPNSAPLRLVVTHVPDALTIFLEGDAFASNMEPFGDGVRCIGGNLLRFGDQIAGGGRAVYPDTGQTAISVLTAPPHGATRYYQAIYRNANAGWCSPATFNSTNAMEIVWH